MTFKHSGGAGGTEQGVGIRNRHAHPGRLGTVTPTSLHQHLLMLFHWGIQSCRQGTGKHLLLTPALSQELCLPSTETGENSNCAPLLLTPGETLGRQLDATVWKSSKHTA